MVEEGGSSGHSRSLKKRFFKIRAALGERETQAAKAEIEKQLVLSDRAQELVKSFEKHEALLPDEERDRLSVVIPARRASVFMNEGLPLLCSQIEECVSSNKIKGADVVVVFNRGGDEGDRGFARDFEVEGFEKVLLWEKQDALFSDPECSQGATLADAGDEEKRVVFIHQEDVENNSGAAQAKNTGFQAIAGAAQKDGKVSKYLLTLDTDNRLHTTKRLDGYSGNGLLKLIDIQGRQGSFAVGPKLEPAVFKENGELDLEKNVAGLVQATTNIHTKVSGFQWTPGGGTLSMGKDALAAQLAIGDEDMQIEDVSFGLFMGEIEKKDIQVTDEVMVVDAAPPEEPKSIKEIINIRKMVREWAGKEEPLETLLAYEEIPNAWKKMTRWLQGQKYVEGFFGKEFVNGIVKPKLTNIVIGNTKAILQERGYGPDAIREMVRLIKEIPSYLTIQSALRMKTPVNEGGVSW